jgi:DNA-directed RNA polymerase subunit M/transcription elongation factor TFIIS
MPGWSKCKTCKSMIYWVTSKSGKNVALSLHKCDSENTDTNAEDKKTKSRSSKKSEDTGTTKNDIIKDEMGNKLLEALTELTKVLVSMDNRLSDIEQKLK